MCCYQELFSIAGALIVVKNYTGDRINFGLASERAKAEGMSCDLVSVAEDCSLTSHDKTAGRRGLCGVVLLNKVSVPHELVERFYYDLIRCTR